MTSARAPDIAIPVGNAEPKIPHDASFQPKRPQPVFICDPIVTLPKEADIPMPDKIPDPESVTSPHSPLFHAVVSQSRSGIGKRMASNPSPTPVEVDEMTQFLSKLQYQTNVTDKLGNVYIDVVDSKTGTTQPQSIFNYIRNTYDSMLEQVDNSGEIARLRKEYAQVKSVTDPIEGSWLNGLDLAKTTDEELADAMSLALRRLRS